MLTFRIPTRLFPVTVLAAVFAAAFGFPALPATAEVQLPAGTTATATITKLSPTTGVVTGGSVVTITGAGFIDVTAVTFGSTAAIKFDVVSSSRITAISPAQNAASSSVTLTTAAGTSNGAKFTVRTLEQEVLVLTNQARATKRKCGSTTYRAAPRLRFDATLAKVAEAHSRDMAARNYFSHYSLKGVSPFSRMKASGYYYDSAGENIAAGYRTPKSVVTAWLKSPGHCKNLMKRGYTELGVGYTTGGYYGTYWTQDFGNPR